MGNLKDKIEKATRDAIKSVSDQINDAKKNIINTTKSGFTSINNAQVSIKDSIRNNTFSQQVKNNVDKALAPVVSKLNNFQLDFNKLGYDSLLPFKNPMVKLMLSKGVKVSYNDPISKVVNLFYDSVVKGKQNFEYKQYLEHAESEGGGNNIDWAAVVKICATVLTWCKEVWSKNQKERAARMELISAQANYDVQKIQELMRQDEANRSKTPIDTFAEETIDTVITGNAKQNIEWQSYLKYILGGLALFFIIRAILK